MMSGIGGSSFYASLPQGQQRPQGAQGPGSGKHFKQIDTDGNGGVDKAEFQAIADKISGMTGKEINVDELTKSHDANGDGLLGQDEMQALMMELRPSGGPPTQQALAAYQQQLGTDKDLTSTLMDMLGESDEEDDDDKNETSSINTNA